MPRVLLLVALVLAFGCRGQLPPRTEVRLLPRPVVAATNITVLLDTKFSYLEESRIIIGLDSWVEALGPRTLQIHYGLIDNPIDKVAPAGTVHLVRMKTMKELKMLCSTSSLVLACWKTGERMVPIAAEAITFDQFSTVGAHELGHALGLDHRAPPSIMAETIEKMSLVPQKGDVEAYCRLHPCVKTSAL